MPRMPEDEPDSSGPLLDVTPRSSPEDRHPSPEEDEEDRCECCRRYESVCDCYRCETCECLTEDCPCSECQSCVDCCECWTCGNCERRYDSTNNYSCEVCGYCREYDCCECRLCESCEEHHRETCGNCDRCEHCCTADEDEDTYCGQFGGGQRSPYIYSYSTDVMRYLTAKPSFQSSPRDTRWYGLELEIKTRKGADFSTAITALREVTKEWAIMKRDGSLPGNGVELVTCPMTLEHHRTCWPTVQECLREYFTGWGFDGMGVHIHISRRSLRPLLLGKFLVFMNSPLTRKGIEKLAGRGEGEWSRYYPKKICDCRRINDGRYESVNLQNQRTAEVRIFQSCTKVERVMMYLEFLDALLAHLNEQSLVDVQDWDGFVRWVSARRQLWPYLAHYLQTFSSWEGLTYVSSDLQAEWVPPARRHTQAGLGGEPGRRGDCGQAEGGDHDHQGTDDPQRPDRRHHAA